RAAPHSPEPRAREPRAAPSARGAAANHEAYAAWQRRSPLLDRALPLLAWLARRARHRPTRHRGPLAPDRVQGLLDLEKPQAQTWPSSDPGRYAGLDPKDEQGESALRPTEDSR